MFTCKQVSNALAKQDYETLSPVRKALLKFHVLVCAVCGGYNNGVMIMQDTAREFRKHEDETADTLPGLDPEQKREIAAAVKSGAGE